MKLPRAQILAAAREFGRLFPRDSFVKWTFGGSLRRGSADCKDAEHVVIPAIGELPPAQDDLFATPRMGNLLWHHLDQLLAEKVVDQAFVNGSPRWGERYRKVLFAGVVHDVFRADVDNWGAILAIRTGPGEFSKRLVTMLQRNGHINHGGYVWNKRDWICNTCGWRGESPTRMPYEHVPADLKGVLRGRWFIDADGRDGGPYWEVCPACPVMPDCFDIDPARVSVPDEETYFKLCGLDWLPPEERR